jgi:CDP-glucose 4,6-dehydratase
MMDDRSHLDRREQPEALGWPSAAFWAGRRVLVTGHTGFKGSWLAHWLSLMGAKVHGLGKVCTTPFLERCKGD